MYAITWKRRLRHDSAQLITSFVQSLDRSLLIYPRVAIPNPRRGKCPERDQYDVRRNMICRCSSHSSRDIRRKWQKWYAKPNCGFLLLRSGYDMMPCRIQCSLCNTPRLRQYGLRITYSLTPSLLLLRLLGISSHQVAFATRTPRLLTMSTVRVVLP
jgi:hypothetical protein